MDKHEFNIKVDQIKKLMGKSDFETAMKIADTIDWRRVRNANLLSMISSVYEKNEEYQEAKDILLIAFERAPVGKRLLYKLAQLAVKQGNVQEAEGYYREFCDLAGDDPRQDILRYLILKAKGAPLEQLIHTLESYTSTELDEKWLYELAELYHQAGMEDACVRTCDKIMLMFGLGQYVDKAMELKLQYAPLTKYQMDLVENRDKYEEKLKQVEQGVGELAASARMGYGNAGPVYQEGGEAFLGTGAMTAGVNGMSGQPEAAFAPGYGAYQQPEAVSAADYGAYQQPEAVPAPGYGAYQQPETVPAPGYGAYQQPEAVPAPGYGAYRQPEGPGLESEETIPVRVRVEPRPIPVAPPVSEAYPSAAPAPETYPSAAPAPEAYPSAVPASEMYPSAAPAQETYPSAAPAPQMRQSAAAARQMYPSTVPVPEESQRQGKEDMVSGISASFGAGAYERADAGVTAEEKLVASVREAEVEARLAEEMSKISMGGYADEPVRQRTRVLNDVKDLKNSEALAGKTKVYGDIRHIQEVKAAREQAQESASKEQAAERTAERGSAEKEPVKDGGQINAAPQAVHPHMMVETRSPETGLDIAVETLKKAHQILGSKHPVVKISGAKLDKKGILASAAKLEGKDLIVEEAGDLSDEMLKELEHLLAKDRSQMLVMLVDTPRQMNGICKAVPALASRFKVVTSMDEAEFYLYEMTGQRRVQEKKENIIKMAPPAAAQSQAVRQRAAEPVYERSGSVEVLRTERPSVQRERGYGESYQEVRAVERAPKEELRRPMAFQEQDEEEDDQTVMGIDEFAQCCCAYADQIDCSITGKSMLALYERIEIMEADGIALTKSAAEDLIEEAADKAEKPSLGKRLTGLFSSKYDKNGSLILKEEHFI